MIHNYESYYFDRTTYFGFQIEIMNKTEYKNFTNSMIKCTGKWCITVDDVKQFGCTSQTYDRCYRADQIIILYILILMYLIIY